jgi:hypothetical protein
LWKYGKRPPVAYSAACSALGRCPEGNTAALLFCPTTKSSQGTLSLLAPCRPSSSPLPKDIPYALDTEVIALLFLNSGKKSFDGFIIHYLSSNNGNVSAEEINVLVKNIAFNSEFFRRLWIVLPDKNNNVVLNMLLDTLKCLELNNVAIALLCDDTSTRYLESWRSMISVFNPMVESPQQESFFPTDNEYCPRWSHLLSKQI